MPNLHDKKFPNESPEYREARNKVLKAETELREKIEEVAELRRGMPMGGKLKEDYVFEELDSRGDEKQTKLSELFSPGKNSLIIYSFMFAPDDEKACPACTSIMDGIDGMVFHVNDRTNFVAISRAPIQKFKSWANGRRWKNLRLLSSEKNTYNHDYFGENSRDKQTPILNVFHKTPEGIFHFYGTELMFVKFKPGLNERHVDMIWPIWNLFDFTPEGRGTDWFPDFSYEK